MPDSVFLKNTAEKCRAGETLDSSTIQQVVAALFSPATTDDAREDFLTALTDRGETAGELADFSKNLLERAEPLGFTSEWKGRPIIDSCGTGGGGLNLVNVSTGILFILAALGVPAVKHGNRGVTKKSGSADVLEALGLKMDVDAVGVRRTLEEVGAAFVFAPRFHPSFKAIAPVRKKLAAEGRRTIFNLLGPLLNPSRPKVHLLGVFKEEHLKLFAETLSLLEPDGRGFVVCGKDEKGRPIGEGSPFGTNQLAEVRGNKVKFFPLKIQRMYPLFPASTMKSALVTSAEKSARLIEEALSNQGSNAVRSLLIMNAALGALACEKTFAPKSQPELLFHSELEPGQGLEPWLMRCREAITSGAAQEKLRQWRKLSAKL